jgi:hypothetical protein
MTRYRTIQLPEDLCATAENWLAGRFDNLEALLSFLLREVAKDNESTLDQTEQELVQQRLRELGYI